MFGTKILEERKSKFNGDIKVVRSLGFGTYIQVNCITQSGGVVKDFWSQTLKRLRKERINSVLILGLGGGTLLKLINKYWPKAIVTGIEIDPLMVEMGEKYLELKKKNLDIRTQDAYEFIKTDKKKYDLVIVDLYVGDKFPKKFEEEKFLKLLTKNKIVIFNRLYFKEKKEEAKGFGKKLEKIFRSIEWFYPQINLMFICQR